MAPSDGLLAVIIISMILQSSFCAPSGLSLIDTLTEYINKKGGSLGKQTSKAIFDMVSTCKMLCETNGSWARSYTCSEAEITRNCNDMCESIVRNSCPGGQPRGGTPGRGRPSGGKPGGGNVDSGDVNSVAQIL